jgi:cell division protein FtsZ
MQTGNSTSKNSRVNTVDDGKNTVGKIFVQEPKETLNSSRKSVPLSSQQKKKIKDSNPSSPAASGGYLARPSNIYAESKPEEITSKSSVEEPTPKQPATNETGEDPDMQLVFREDVPAADEPLADQTPPPVADPAEDPAMQDEAGEQKRKAAERLQKLRNLSFNVNAADLNKEFENVPAYIRRNMELYGASTVAENFYSNYEVKTDENNNTHISTINTFLDGKKPD